MLKSTFKNWITLYNVDYSAKKWCISVEEISQEQYLEETKTISINPPTNIQSESIDSGIKITREDNQEWLDWYYIEYRVLEEWEWERYTIVPFITAWIFEFIHEWLESEKTYQYKIKSFTETETSKSSYTILWTSL